MASLTLLILGLVVFAQALLLPLLHGLHGLLAPHGALALLVAAALGSWLLLSDGDEPGRARHNPATKNYQC
jgi:hypothetical protein